jgi:hypothetical protein
MVDATPGPVRRGHSDDAVGDGVGVDEAQGRPAAADEREEPALEHGPDARRELAVARSVHHGRPHHRGPHAPEGVGAEDEPLRLLLGAAVRVLERQLGKRRGLVRRHGEIPVPAEDRRAAHVD